MVQYLPYGMVQERLCAHRQQTGRPYSFYEAATELWAEQRFLTAPSVPVPAFDQWDAEDLLAFEGYMYGAPVTLDMMRVDARDRKPAALAAQRISELDVLPLLIANHQAMGLHHHDAFEMSYVLRGSARLFLNDTSRIVSTGELCILAPQFDHDIIPEDDALVVSVALWEHTIEDTLHRLLKSENIVADFFRTSLIGRERGYLLFTLPPEKDILRVIRGIFQEGYQQGEYAREMCAMYIEILLAKLLQYHSQEHYELAEKSDASSFLAILKYIQRHSRDITLGKVAELFHYEANYLSKLIKQRTGKNYTEIVSELRIWQAKKLLRETTCSLEQVARDSGFHSAVHFSRSFKANVGVSPGQYRRENGEGQQEKTLSGSESDGED